MLGKVGDLARAAAAAEKAVEGVEVAGRVATNELRATHAVSRKAVARLAADIEKNGMWESVKYVERAGEKPIVDGNHRLQAARRLGMKSIPAVKGELPHGGYRTLADVLSGMP